MKSPPPELDEVFRAEWPRLVGALCLYTGDPFLAEEFAQEALTRAASHWSKVSRLEAPGAWVYRVGLNVAHSHFRRIRVARRKDTQLRAAQLPTDEADLVTKLLVRSAVTDLPERQRRVLILRYWLDLSVDDVAEIMRCPANTVKTLSRRALLALRDSLHIDELAEATNVDRPA